MMLEKRCVSSSSYLNNIINVLKLFNKRNQSRHCDDL